MSKYDGHTPGPWRCFNGIDIYPDDDDRRGRRHIADCAPEGYQNSATDMTVDEAWANARLIADAPTLLAQRDEAVALLKKHFGWEGEQIGPQGVRRLYEETEAFLLRLEKEPSNASD